MSKTNPAGRLGACLALGLALSLSPAARGAEEPPAATVTLEAARAKALESSTDLRAATARALASGGASRQARALPVPDLSFEAEDFGGNLPDESVSQRTLSVEERVEWPGRRSARVEAARREQEVAALDAERVRLDVRQEAERRFAALLAAQERREISEENAATAREVREAVSALVAAGEASPIEETRARAEEALAGIDRDAAARDTVLASRSLALLWGDVSGAVVRAEGRLSSDASEPARDAALQALPRLPDLLRWEAEAARLEALETLARRQALPDVTVSAGVRSFVGTGQRTWVAGLSLPIPLPAAYSGARAEASGRLEEARASKRGEEARTRAALLSSIEELRHAATEVRLLEEQVLPGARQTYLALSEGYRRGKFRLLDLLEARRSLATARLRLVDALARMNLSAADLRRLTPDDLPRENGDPR